MRPRKAAQIADGCFDRIHLWLACSNHGACVETPPAIDLRFTCGRGSWGLDELWTGRYEYYRQAAVFVDKILKGAKPDDLPVEQAMLFDLVVNMKTAKALGITIPPTIMVQAARVIE